MKGDMIKWKLDEMGIACSLVNTERQRDGEKTKDNTGTRGGRKEKEKSFQESK